MSVFSKSFSPNAEGLVERRGLEMEPNEISPLALLL